MLEDGLLKKQIVQPETAHVDDIQGASGVTYWGHDPDDVCAYLTPKVSRIRSWKLGLIQFVLKFFIFGYIIIYQMGIMMGYLNFESIDSTGIKSTVYAPASYKSFETLPPYCCECNTTTGLPIKPLDKMSPLYKPPYHTCIAGSGKPGTCCVEMDKEGIRSVRTTSQSIGVATSMQFQRFSSSCPGQNPNTTTLGMEYPVSQKCNMSQITIDADQDGKADPNTYFYTMGIEKFTLSITHSISSPALSNVIDMDLMRGTLVGGKVI